MPISSLIHTAVALVSAGTWGFDPSQNRESDFRSPSRSELDVSEVLSGNQMRSDDSEAHGACAGDVDPPSVCATAEAADEVENARTFKLSDGATQISNADKKMQPITLVSAMTPLLLSAIAGFAFASGGRRYKR